MPLIGGKLWDVEEAVLSCFPCCVTETPSELAGFTYLQFCYSPLMQDDSLNLCAAKETPANQITVSGVSMGAALELHLGMPDAKEELLA